MKTEIIHVPSQKSWGLPDHTTEAGHFYTGYVYNYGAVAEGMVPGRNAIIAGDFAFDKTARGQSRANLVGHFRGQPKVPYIFSLSGVLELIQGVQEGRITSVDGYLAGQWTFAKQGENMFLKPYRRP